MGDTEPGGLASVLIRASPAMGGRAFFVCVVWGSEMKEPELELGSLTDGCGCVDACR